MALALIKQDIFFFFLLIFHIADKKNYYPLFSVVWNVFRNKPSDSKAYGCFNKQENVTSYFGILSQDSLQMIPNAMVDWTVRGAKPFSKYQFERVGFFCVDPDSTDQEVGNAIWLCYTGY